MPFTEWLNLLRSAEKTSVIHDKVRKVHYKFPDGTEMAEEYSMDTGVIFRRAWKDKKDLRGEPNWNIELGEKVRNINESFLVRESNTEPFLTKRITKTNIEWRIRNLPYSIETYLVTANTDSPVITVRTTNKKFFKIIKIEELERCGLKPKQSNITINHQYNTLIITYKKPQEVIDMEKAVLIELKDVETTKGLNMDCNELLEQLMK